MLTRMIREALDSKKKFLIETSDYRTLMRTIDAYMRRNQIPECKYSKVLVVDPVTLETTEAVRIEGLTNETENDEK